jgi:NAD(P)-dependent dehydrogenase (short-subunit alcohol dehydrogenase family)
VKETMELCCKENAQLIYTFDLTKITEVEESLSAFIAANGIEIHHFVHCAGFMKMLPLKMVSIEMINTTFTTNVISAALLAKVLVQRKINNAALQSIIFVSSNISNYGAKAFSIYAASKGALDSLMRCLAIELAPHVRVNSVLPGAIETKMTSHIFENKETIEKLKAAYPLGLGNVDDISNMIEFMLSDKARWLTGQQITIDGGSSINLTA